MFQQILLPTDGSPLSDRAVLAGINFARELGAQVVALAVTPEFHTLSLNTEMLEDTKEQWDAACADRAAKHLAFVTDAARLAGVPCTTCHLSSDHPYEAILQTARDRNCDLIIMGSHGRPAPAGVLLGSETQKVLLHSTIPVLVYR